MEDLTNLKRKVNQYQEVLQNTRNYRDTWKTSLKDSIISQIEAMLKETELPAKVNVKESVENMEAVVVSLGQVKSGIFEDLGNDVKRHLIKHNGSLIYQQLFNGKIVVLINFPIIEGYGQPRPPKQISIYRPEEIKPPFVLRHMEEFMKEITSWEDFDDDEPHAAIGFNMNYVENLEPSE